MLSEKETNDMCAMVSEYERLIDSRLPGYAVATWNLQRLATTTGDEWESVVRSLLAARSAVETSGDCISCSVGNPGVYIKDGSMVCPHRPALNTSPSPAFVGSLCAHVPKGFACEICNHDGEQE